MDSVRIINIGRGQDNDIVLFDPSISRHHLQVFINEEGLVFVTDLNSSNGTYINGNRLRGTAILHAGDILRLGTDKPLKWQLWLYANKEPQITDSEVENSTEHTHTGKSKNYWKAILFSISAAIFLYILALLIIKNR